MAIGIKVITTTGHGRGRRGYGRAGGKWAYLAAMKNRDAVDSGGGSGRKEQITVTSVRVAGGIANHDGIGRFGNLCNFEKGCRRRVGLGGIPPKAVADTRCASGAAIQCAANIPSKVIVFPPCCAFDK